VTPLLPHTLASSSRYLGSFLSSPRILSLFQSILHFIVVCLYHTVYWNPFHIHSILHILLLISHTCYIPRYLISMSVDVNVRLMMMMSMRQPFFFLFLITPSPFLHFSHLPHFPFSIIPTSPNFQVRLPIEPTLHPPSPEIAHTTKQPEICTSCHPLPRKATMMIW
jgi:hypothetical protein